MTAKGPKRTIWVMEMFYIITVAVTRVKATIKTQEGIHLKYVQFVVGKLSSIKLILKNIIQEPIVQFRVNQLC